MNFSNISRKEAFILLNGLPKLGPISTSRLLAAFKGDPKKILHASKQKLLSVSGIGDAMISSIQDVKNENWLEKEVGNIRKHNASFIIDGDIPRALHEIYDTPLGLYQRGTIPDGPYISIVGTRMPSLYAQKICQQLSFNLAKKGFCIVSGMARGIDAIAHQAALDAKGKTIAFLGTGIDIIYPPEHLTLYQEIISKGAVLSEFSFGRKADRKTFPMRNRLVSGISSGTVVVESGATGGSLITARFAGEQGRSVFAVPGRVDQTSSIGCHQLIRDGAILIRNANDIIDDLLPSLDFDFITPSLTTEDNQKKQSSEIYSEKEMIIMQALQTDGTLNSEEINSRTAMPVQSIASTLTALELSGYISKRTDGRYEIV
ncbi:MAG: DNA-processing protein DprA [Opitutales bacterium]|nr:DNA-processing protein DprA [Opitutales bacterium]